MYKKNVIKKTSLRVNESVDGETIEQKMDRIINNNEAITDGAPVTYTERKEGVLAAYNIRTDRFDVAIDAMDRVTSSAQAKREERAKEREVIKLPDSGAEPTQGTNP